MCELYRCFQAHFLLGGERNTVGTTEYRLVDLAATVDGGIGALRRQYFRPEDTCHFSPYVKEMYLK